MSRDDLFEKLKEILRDKLEISDDTEITREMTFRDLGADSLDVYGLVYAIEGELGVSIPDERANAFDKVGDAVDFIFYLKEAPASETEAGEASTSEEVPENEEPALATSSAEVGKTWDCSGNFSEFEQWKRVFSGMSIADRLAEEKKLQEQLSAEIEALMQGAENMRQINSQLEFIRNTFEAA